MRVIEKTHDPSIGAESADPSWAVADGLMEATTAARTAEAIMNTPVLRFALKTVMALLPFEIPGSSHITANGVSCANGVLSSLLPGGSPHSIRRVSHRWMSLRYGFCIR